MSIAIDRPEVEERADLIVKIAALARIPDAKRDAFVHDLVNARQLARYREIFADPLGRDPVSHAAVIAAQRKVLAARDAIDRLSTIDLAILDGFGNVKIGTIDLLKIVVERFALLTGTEMNPPPTSGRRGRRKGTTNDPTFREFINLLCGAIYYYDGHVTFSSKSSGRGTRVTGTLIEILTLLQPHLRCIPRELSSRAEMIEAALKANRPRKGGQNSK